MRYIVTGGAGFIGSNLADTLAQNHDVVIIDNLATGRRENIEHLLDHPRVTFIEGSITDLDLLMEVFPGADGIFHQAAIPSVPRSVIEPPRLERGERDRHGERARGGKGLRRACPFQVLQGDSQVVVDITRTLDHLFLVL
jgi:NAD(P)-dependent dehydrogenase (short-subunit alcohol dehydrogenase family)